MSKQTTITSMHHDYAARYAALAGMSVKAAVEYAIELAIVPQLIDYGADVDEPERDSERLLEEVRRVLPSGWSIHIHDAFIDPSDGSGGFKKRAPTLAVHFGIGGPHAFTEASTGALLLFCRDLELLAEFGGFAYLEGENGSPCLVARRRGQGLTIEHAAPGAGHAIAKTSFPTKMLKTVVQGLRKAVEAAQLAEGE